MFSMPQPDVVGWLTMVPADDQNFKAALHRASLDDLKEAILSMSGSSGNKTRILACQREYRRRVQG